MKQASIPKQATLYHAASPACVHVARELVRAVDPEQYEVEVVHLLKQRQRIPEAEGIGVESVPALVIDGRVFHINFGARLEDVKQAVGGNFQRARESVVLPSDRPHGCVK